MISNLRSVVEVVDTKANSDVDITAGVVVVVVKLVIVADVVVVVDVIVVDDVDEVTSPVTGSNKSTLSLWANSISR